jgi:GNAT superfamily N-acetyltransferase
MKLEFHSMQQRPEFGQDVMQWYDRAWPQFLLHGDAAAGGRFQAIMDAYKDFQTYAYDANHQAVVGFSQTAPILWNGRSDDLPAGWDGAVYRIHAGIADQAPRTTLCALAATVNPQYQGQGLAAILLQCKKDLAQRQGYRWLIAPVRPSHKHLYPTIPLTDYALWENGRSGHSFDPWIRTHQRSGGRVVKVDDCGMDVSAGLDQWEAWTGLRMPSSGSYVIPKGNDLLQVDGKARRGFYREGCVWVVYDLQPSAAP